MDANATEEQLPTTYEGRQSNDEVTIIPIPSDVSTPSLTLRTPGNTDGNVQITNFNISNQKEADLTTASTSSNEGTRLISNECHQALKSELQHVLENYELDSVEELLDLVESTKRTIAELKRKGKEKTAKEKEVTLGELEKLQSLAEQVKTLTGSGSQPQTIQQLESDLQRGLENYELDSVEELLDLVESTKRTIAELKRKGKEKTAKEKEVTLGELEKLQSLAEQIKTLTGSGAQPQTIQQLESDLQRGLENYELDSVEELLDLIESTKRTIAELKRKGKEKTAKEKEVTLGELEKLQSLALQVKALKSVAVQVSASNNQFNEKKKETHSVWIVRSEGQKATKVTVECSEIQDFDDLKGLLFGEIEKGLYTGYFNGTELQPDASIPTDTVAKNPIIFKNESSTASATISQKVKQDSNSANTDALRTFESAATRLLRNAKVIKVGENGYPTIYKVGFKEQIISRQYSLRKCHIGEKIPVHGYYPTEKTIMILGATGAGKSTMVNGLVNYYYGVQWNDNFRLQLITEEDEGIQGVAKSQAKSQTRWITAYTLHNEPDCAVPYTLTLIDTPGYGDSDGIQRDREITNQVRELFSNTTASEIDHIDAIGFVVQSSVARLTHTQKYIFDSVLSLFGKDIVSNIMLIITFCDGQQPPVLVAVKEGAVPYGEYFKFNNSALFAKNNSTEVDTDASFDVMFWKLGYDSLKRFFTEFQKITPASLSLTKETLKERHRLETTVQGIQPQIQNGLSKLETLRQEAAVLKRHANDITANKDFKYMVDVHKHRQVNLSTGTYVTNCLKCNSTCHYPCAISNDSDKRGCAAMNEDNCTVCPGKCHWQQHKNNTYRFESYVEKEPRTYSEMLKRYENAQDEFGRKTGIFESIVDDFKQTQYEVIKLIAIARKAVERIEEIALKANPLSIVSYIELMIESEKQERKPGYIERIKHLEIVKKQAELIQNVKNANFDPFKNVVSVLDEFKDIAIPSNPRKEAGLLEKLKSIFT